MSFLKKSSTEIEAGFKVFVKAKEKLEAGISLAEQEGVELSMLQQDLKCKQLSVNNNKQRAQKLLDKVSEFLK